MFEMKSNLLYTEVVDAVELVIAEKWKDSK